MQTVQVYSICLLPLQGKYYSSAIFFIVILLEVGRVIYVNVRLSQRLHAHNKKYKTDVCFQETAYAKQWFE